jgi:hypothetical protein
MILQIHAGASISGEKEALASHAISWASKGCAAARHQDVCGDSAARSVTAAYTRPASLDEVITQTAGRALDQLRLPRPATPRWTPLSRPGSKSATKA